MNKADSRWMRGVRLAVGVTLVLLGPVLMWIGVTHLVEIPSASAHVQGVVTEVHHGGRSCDEDVSYVVDQVSWTTTVGTCGTVGDSFGLRYDPKNPAHAFSAGVGAWVGNAFQVFLGLFLILVGGLQLWLRGRSFRKFRLR